MKKISFSLLTILLFTACQKQISTNKVSEEIVGAAENKQAKITVCHYDAVTGTSNTININYSAWPAHQAHGDLEGECPGTITICNQTWMLKNLDVTTYRNGDPIPQVSDITAWRNLTTGAWCYYENDLSNGPVYGKLYNWYAVNDPRGLAPSGWHVPSHAEWNTLINCLGGISIAGGKLKETGTTHWLTPNLGATNSSGFTGLPGGYRYFNGVFYYVGNFGIYWSSTAGNPTEVLARALNSASEGVYLYSWFKQAGFSVRCVKD